MKKLMLYVALMLPMCLGAQQNVGFKKSQVEPLVINADKSVTFNVEAPKAKSVTIRGDWPLLLTEVRTRSVAVRLSNGSIGLPFQRT